MLELTLRLVFSLAVVLGLLLLIARISARRFRGQSDSLVRVIHRQPLSRSNAVCVVAVGTRILVLGTTEHQVRVLAELDPEEIEEAGAIPALAPEARPRPITGGAHRADVPAIALPAARSAGTRAATPIDDGGALAGSVLSASTWKQALAAATRRAT